MKRNKPINAINSKLATKLIGKNVLYANDELGLGYYGILQGIDQESGKFIVKSTAFNNAIVKCTWIVEF